MIELLERLGYGYDGRCTWIAAGLVAVGALLVVWLVLPERWRRLGRPCLACPRCHYDLRGIVGRAAFPVTCAECGLEIGAERLRLKPRPVRRTGAVVLVLLLAAHVTALWPQARHVGPKRYIPSTVLILQPMDAGAWTDAQLRYSMGPTRPSGRGSELARRLFFRELWRWQEWLLCQRVARACRHRGDYGITPAQYDTAVRLYTTRTERRGRETLAERLANLAETAGATFIADWERLEKAAVIGPSRNERVMPQPPGLLVAHALDSALDPEAWDDVTWDVTPDGSVVILNEKVTSTARCRLYDVSDLAETLFDRFALIDLITQLVDADHWVDNGGSTNAAFAVSDHLVVLAPARVHMEIEDLLEGLRDAIADGPPPLPGDEPPANPRQIAGSGGLLNDLRYLRAVPVEAVRAAGPNFTDGVTEEELDRCGRDSFGLLDRVRQPPPARP